MIQFDACDRCGAKALVMVRKYNATTGVTTGSLFFCGHHGTMFLPALESADWRVVSDSRPPVLAPATVG